MAKKTTKLVGYGISFDMSLVGGVKTADDFNKAAKSIEKSINKSSNAVKQHELQVDILSQAYSKGAISTKEYEQQQTSLAYKELKRTERLEKQRRAVLGLDKQESKLAKARQQRARFAGMSAAGVSGLGMGGRAAGAARFLGGASTMATGVGLAGGFAAATVVKESIEAFTELETQVTAMKSLFGEEIAGKLNQEFRNLAKTTILTNSQLIENAKTWASYGLTTDGLTDRLKRLGTVAGGNSEKFRALTIAFAQVNAQGKLMGQEKNQLINAGFSLQAVADAAGISMEDFADAMKNGEIQAEHLNKALINVTSEGGLFADYLEKQAETIQGKLTILAASWNEFLVALGGSEKGPVMTVVDALTRASDVLKQAVDAWNRAKGFTEPGVPDPMVGQYGVVQAGGVTSSELLSAAGGAAIVDFGGEDVGKTARSAYDERFFDEANAALVQTIQDLDKVYAFDKETAKIKRDKEKIAIEAREQRERNQIDRLFKKKVSIEDYMLQYNATQSEALRKNMEERYAKQIENYVDPYRGEQSFVGPLPASEKQRAMLEKEEKDKEELRMKQEALIEAQKGHANVVFEREMERLKQDEKQVAERLKADKSLAKDPSQRDAYFEGGSVEEFQFLRKSKQENETAKAIREAEERARQQRDEIARQRKDAETKREQQLQELTLAQSEIGISD